jgi:hypothetical protein
MLFVMLCVMIVVVLLMPQAALSAAPGQRVDQLSLAT